jgi:hypothetical protein
MPRIIYWIMRKLISPTDDVTILLILLPKATLSRTKNRVVPSSCSLSTKAHVTSQNVGGSS